MPIAEHHQIPDLATAVVRATTKVIAFNWSLAVGVVWPLKPAYCLAPKLFVDDDRRTPDGLPILGLSALADEDPGNTIIVVCSGSLSKAYEKVKPFGDFTLIPFFSMVYLYPHLATLRSLAMLPTERKAPRQSRLGIVVRGRVEGATTIQVCRQFAKDYPDAYLLASTWKDTAPEDVAALEKVCSEILLLDPPELPGVQNKNYQIRSAVAGMAACRKAGVERVLLTRNDLFLFAPDLLRTFDSYRASFSTDTVRGYGMEGRIVVGNTSTRKYIPYHPSDLFMYGALDDLLQMWSAAPYDERPNVIDALALELDPVSIGEVARRGEIAENHVCIHWLKQLGRPLDFTVADSMALYRDFFVVVDYTFTGAFWPKKYLFDHAPYLRGLKQCLSQQEWTALYAGTPYERIAPIRAEAQPWRAFRTA
jgi:hypothetical protein